jgi:hypothetical protein
MPFLGIHKSEPYIYIGLSPALHLQCMNWECSLILRDSQKYLLVATAKNELGTTTFRENIAKIVC